MLVGVLGQHAQLIFGVVDSQKLLSFLLPWFKEPGCHRGGGETVLTDAHGHAGRILLFVVLVLTVFMIQPEFPDLFGGS